MRLDRIVIRQFRNISHADLTFSKQVTLWVGANGHGKTNGLEAIATLAALRHRPGIRDIDVIQWDRSWTDLRGTWISSEGSPVQSRYAVQISPKPRRVREGSVVPIVGFSPADLLLLQGGPAQRRGFLDQVASTLYPRYARALRLFEKALAQKNRALKENWADAQLQTFNDILADSGSTVWRLRLESVEALKPLVDTIHSRLAGPDAVSMHLQPGGVDHREPPTTADDARYRIEARSKEERVRQMALVGPHRDDLLIDLHGHSATNYASQGQQRSIVLSLKLAANELFTEVLGVRPLLLLDDVMSELDPARRQHLLSVVTNPQQQTIITDTEVQSYPSLNPSIVHVERGSFT